MHHTTQTKNSIPYHPYVNISHLLPTHHRIYCISFLSPSPSSYSLTFFLCIVAILSANHRPELTLLIDSFQASIFHSFQSQPIPQPHKWQKRKDNKEDQPTLCPREYVESLVRLPSSTRRSTPLNQINNSLHINEFG